MSVSLTSLNISYRMYTALYVTVLTLAVFGGLSPLLVASSDSW